MNITHLRVNGLEEPLGFSLEPVRLSWITENNEGESAFQQAARVEIARDASFEELIWDSGKDEHLSSLSYTPEGLELQPRTRYYWRATVWGDQGDYTVSAPSWFETAKMEESWQAHWITPGDELPKDAQPLLKAAWTVDKPVQTVRVYACGLGIYELFLNGKKAGDEYLLPGFHAYDYWLQYQTFDVSDMVRQGDNVIGFSLGPGWYKGRFGFNGGHTNLYGEDYAVIAEVVVTFTDGTEQVLRTDDSWRAAISPVTFSNIYDGEVYDATKADDGWAETPDMADWHPVREKEPYAEPLTARYSPAITIMETRAPAEILHTPAGETVLDMGQNMTGWVRFRTEAPAGTVLQLKYGEVLQDGSFYQENLRTAEAQYTYIADGKERSVEPAFTFYGFRYVKLIGFENVSATDFTGCVVYSEMERTGTVETSNERVNRLFENAVWSQKGNFLDVPTDCPQRDERLGWTGDAQIFAATASMNMHTQAFFRKYLKDVREEQLRMNGAVPFLVPEIKPAEGGRGFLAASSIGSTAWGDAATVIPWALYQQYGDLRQLEEHYPIMADWVDYLRRTDDTTREHRLLTEGFHFGDWLALDGSGGFDEDRFGGTDVYYIASAYYCYSAALTAKAASALGKAEEAAKYEQLSEEIKQAVQRKYFSPAGKCIIPTQTAHAVALYMDLVPEHFKPGISAELHYLLTKNKSYLQTGFVGTPYLNHALSDNGMNTLAYTLLLNDKYPSWLYEVDMGATTIWERWNSVLPDGSMSGTGMNSLNHYAYGSIAEWMYTKMCGIQMDEAAPGYKRMTLAPQPDDRLTYARASIRAASGYVACGWEFDDEDIHITCSVPFDTEARIILPGAAGKKVRINDRPQTTAIQRGDHDLEMVLTKGEYHIVYPAGRWFSADHGVHRSINELYAHGTSREILLAEAPGLAGEEVVWTNYPDTPLQELLHIPVVNDKIDKKVLARLKARLEAER